MIGGLGRWSGKGDTCAPAQPEVLSLKAEGFVAPHPANDFDGLRKCGLPLPRRQKRPGQDSRIRWHPSHYPGPESIGLRKRLSRSAPAAHCQDRVPIERNKHTFTPRGRCVGGDGQRREVQARGQAPRRMVADKERVETQILFIRQAPRRQQRERRGRPGVNWKNVQREDTPSRCSSTQRRGCP